MLPRRRRVAHAAHDVRAARLLRLSTAAAVKRHERVTLRTLRRVVDVLGAHAPVLVKPLRGEVDGARLRSRRLLGRRGGVRVWARGGVHRVIVDTQTREVSRVLGREAARIVARGGMAPRADVLCSGLRPPGCGAGQASAAQRKVQIPAAGVGVARQEESTFQYGKTLDKITRSASVTL